MKNIFILCFVFFALTVSAQSWETVSYEGKTAEEIQKKIHTWIAQNYRSAQDVIQQSDPGKVIAKGGSTVSPLYDDGRVAVHYDWPYRYTLDFEIKDGRFRFDVYDILIEPIEGSRKTSYTYDQMLAIVEERNNNLENIKGKSKRRREEASLRSNVQGLKMIKQEIADLREVIKAIPAQSDTADDW